MHFSKKVYSKKNNSGFLNTIVVKNSIFFRP